MEEQTFFFIALEHNLFKQCDSRVQFAPANNSSVGNTCKNMLSLPTPLRSNLFVYRHVTQKHFCLGRG